MSTSSVPSSDDVTHCGVPPSRMRRSSRRGPSSTLIVDPFRRRRSVRSHRASRRKQVLGLAGRTGDRVARATLRRRGRRGVEGAVARRQHGARRLALPPRAPPRGGGVEGRVRLRVHRHAARPAGLRRRRRHAARRGPDRPTPIVRVPWNEQGIIGRVLGRGRTRRHHPDRNSAEEAGRAVAACRYTPAGTRSFGPLGASIRYGAGYSGRADELVACIPMIETRQAVERPRRHPGGPRHRRASTSGPPTSRSPTACRRARQPRRSVPPRARHRRRRVPAPRRGARRPRRPVAGRQRPAAGFRMITVGYDLGNVMGGLRRDLASSRHAVEGGQAP